MTLKEFLARYEEGQLSTQELRGLLRQARSECWPLSEAQKGLFVLHKADPASSAYNLPLCFQIDAAVDLAVVQQACNAVLLSHPVLSGAIAIADADGALTMHVDPLRSADVQLDSTTDALLEQVLDAAIRRPFDLTARLLWRTHLIRLAPDRHVLLFVIHHIVFDGGSIPPFLRTFWRAFRAASGGAWPTPDVIPAIYRDFVLDEQTLLSAPRADEMRDYWLERLSNLPPVLELPSARPRATRCATVGRTHREPLPESLAARLTAQSADRGIGAAAWFLGAYALLLHRYADSNDMVVGVPFARRGAGRFEGVVGNFVNMLPLRMQIDDTWPAQAFLRQVQLDLADAIDHGDYPFTRLVRDLKLPRSTGIPPVFQVAFEYQNASAVDAGSTRALDDGVLDVRFDAARHQEGEYELVLEVVETASGYCLHFKYDAALYDAPAVARMAGHYVELLSGSVGAPDIPLHELKMLTAPERAQLVDGFNATWVDLRDAGVPVLFAEQAARTPDSVALSSFDGSLTYRELDTAARRLAARLRAAGVLPGDRVGLYIDRGVGTVVAMLGIMNCGAAYVPLDPQFPTDRLRYMVRDSGACLILASMTRLEAAVALGGAVPAMAWDDAEAAADAGGDSGLIDAGPLAYVIYTSGSTGEPKGVIVSHAALANFLESMRDRPGLCAADCMFAVTTISFDIAGLELLLPLIVGARCHICPSDVARDPQRLRRALETVQPSVMQATPTTWSLLLRSGWRNEQGMRILCGGEALPDTLRCQFLALGSEAWNLYGPTETTVWSTVHRIVEEGPSSCIGRPIANTQALVFDSRDRLQPIGVPGELCIAGAGVADGYWNKRALTAERFIEHPLSRGSKLYRTGDLARWREDGTLECLGRLDAQVKLRGFRIELEEIERHLLAYPAISEAAVVRVDDDTAPRLFAYYVASEDAPPTSSMLRDHLQARVPEYMVPARYVQVGALPTTPNGKIDRKQLSQRGEEGSTEPAELPRVADGAVEHGVATLVSTVLGVERVGRDDGFFDVGGDSVLAVGLAERIAETFGCAFSVTDVFHAGTVRRLASTVTARRPSSVGHRISPPATPPSPREDGLAIIGISCQFPGANDIDQFWTTLCEGRSGMERLPTEVLINAGVPAAIAEHPAYVPVRSAIADRDCFDAEFFRVTPRDAQLMDPQLRLLLQHAWKAVEDAGYAVRDIADTAVVATTADNGYQTLTAGATDIGSVLSTSEQYVSWLLAQSGTVPTIISHRLGLTGPSYAVHSNCSSSLSALHAAAHCLLAGDARQALVAAASVYPVPSLGYLHQKGLNFSSDGRVKTFDVTADGLVGGEGAAAIVLKRTADAVADRDAIYGVLRGIAVNNDGGNKAGFYAPSPDGQSRVIERVLQSTGIDPRSIGYVEAHGTGTALGDPIELTALARAWRLFTEDRGFCAIGSVKSNIGHLDAAAGLAGCIKVLLSLQHGEIVPTLHYSSPNPGFDFGASPFFVATRRMGWPIPGRPRAALSSFGIGGTNAHALFEQAPLPDASAPVPFRSVLVPLSARNDERLRMYCDVLGDWLERRRSESRVPSLAELAYTLQVGREPMEARVAFVVDDVDTLIEQLRAHVADDADGSSAFSTGVTRAAVLPHALLMSDASALRDLAQQWIHGAEVEWMMGYSSPLRRLHLPTYPFARQQQRLEGPDTGPRETVQRMHPLAHRNVSTLDGQRYAARFDGSEFFLRDHQIHGKRVMPGVVYLEMVRAAVADSLGHQDPEAARRLTIRLRNVVWPRPLTVESPVDVVIDLRSIYDREVAFEVASVAGEGERVVHCQGRAMALLETQAAPIDIAALLTNCPERVDGDASYAVLPSLGFAFGPTFRAVQTLHFGLDAAGRPQVVADIELPKPARAGAAAYVLHPSLMDAAAGAVPSSNTGKPTLPFVIRELDVLGPCGPQMHVHIRFSADSGPNDPVQKFDVEMCDPDGRVCVRMRDYSRRQLDGTVGADTDTLLVARG